MAAPSASRQDNVTTGGGDYAGERLDKRIRGAFIENSTVYMGISPAPVAPDPLATAIPPLPRTGRAGQGLRATSPRSPPS